MYKINYYESKYIFGLAAVIDGEWRVNTVMPNNADRLLRRAVLKPVCLLVAQPLIPENEVCLNAENVHIPAAITL
jgi:hypothetical protein